MSPDVALLAILEAASSGKPNPDGSLSPQSLAAIRKIAKSCRATKGAMLSDGDKDIPEEEAARIRRHC